MYEYVSLQAILSTDGMQVPAGAATRTLVTPHAPRDVHSTVSNACMHGIDTVEDTRPSHSEMRQKRSRNTFNQRNACGHASLRFGSHLFAYVPEDNLGYCIGIYVSPFSPSLFECWLAAQSRTWIMISDIYVTMYIKLRVAQVYPSWMGLLESIIES